jgi:sugar transferase (PEP-CTERM/EpsH1 system associated)
MPATSNGGAATRVMHVVHALRAGGMEFGVVKLANGLDVARVHCAICSTRPAASEMKQALAPHVRLFECGGRAGNDPKLVWDLYRLFVAERPHIVHTHAWGTLVEGLVAARLARVPVVVHGEHGTLQLRAYQRLVQRLAWRAVNRVVSVSSRLADRIAAETGFARDGIHVLRNGVDLSRFNRYDRMAARTSLGLAAESRVAVTLGRLVPVKDHRTLFEAVAVMKRDGHPVTLLVAGDGPLRTSLDSWADTLGIREHVHLVGHTPDVERVLAAADVFVLSSASEGMSNTILEAMASALPVVATRVGGADEMVVEGETGYLVPAAAPRELASAVAAVLADERRARLMGAAGRARAEREFSLGRMIERYEALYIDVARARARAATAGVTQAADRPKVI